MIRALTAGHCGTVASIESLGTLVSRILEHLEGGALDDGFEEPIRRGSASGSVSVIEDPEDPEVHVLQVTLRIMRVPRSGASDFYRRLLVLNHALGGRAALSVDEADVVSLTAARPALDLDPSEVIDLILWTSEKADEFDDLLLTEFGYEHAL